MLNIIKDNLYLEEKEAKVYLAALELGRSRVSVIASKAGLNRITTYEILKRLRERGLAASAVYNDVITFKVVAPEIVMKKMERRLDLAKKALPQLTLLAGSNKNKPRIEYYEGDEGIRTVYEDSLECKEKEIFNIVHPGNLLKTIGQDFLDHYIKKRIRRGIKVKVLMPDTAENKKYGKKEELRFVKFFDKNKYTLPNEILIYDNKIALLSFTAKLGVIVQDDDISQSLRTMWSLIWDKL